MRLLTLVLCFLVIATAGAQTPPDRRADEDLLKTARIATDGSGLLDYLRSRELTAETSKRIEALVEALGSGTFRAREKATAELMKIGVPARPALKKAVESSDAEVRKRAQDCLDDMEQQASAEVEAAAVRLLRVRKPEGACAALLRFLPTANNEGVEEESLTALLELAVKNGKLDGAIVQGLKDSDPRRRAASALVAGKAGDDVQRATVLGLMKKDADHRVRLRAAQGLVSHGEKAAVPGLIAQLTEAPPEIAQQALDVLAVVAGDKAPPDPLGNDALSRKKVQANWDAWWNDHQNRVDLAKAAGDGLWTDPSNRARKVVTAFVEAMGKFDPDAIRRTTDVPFDLAGAIVLSTREQFDSFIIQGLKNAPRQKIEFNPPQIIDLNQYLKGTDDKTREFLSKYPRSELRAVSVTATSDKMPGPVKTVLLVRIRGSKAHVIGIGNSQKWN